jgi:disulfide oxidoreductase YuzD
LKTDLFVKRFKAEYGDQRQMETEEALKHEIEKIRDEVFNMPFRESSQEIISKFH